MINDCTLYHEYNEKSLQIAISIAISKNSFEDIKYIFSSPLVKHKDKIDIHLGNDSFLAEASSNGNLEIVRYLLTSTDLKEHSNIRANHGYAFNLACRYGHLDVVKYLTASPELNKHVNIFEANNYALQLACQHNQVEIVRYLLTSNELNNHPDILDKSHSSFQLASINNSFDVIKYLIFDYNIENNDYIKMIRDRYYNSEVEKMFELRKTHDDLKQELNNHKEKNKNLNISNKKLKL